MRAKAEFDRVRIFKTPNGEWCVSYFIRYSTRFSYRTEMCDSHSAAIKRAHELMEK